MKRRVVLPLILLLLSTILLAVESAPSNVVGYVKYPCVVGANFIALPMNSGYTMASDVATAYPGTMNVINAWDPSTQSWLSAIDMGGFFDGDFPVDTKSTLFINAVTAFTFYSMGALPASPATYTLVAGANSIMLPLNHSEITLASELALSAGTINVVNSWDNSTQSWVSAIDLGGFFDGDFPVVIGMPLFVNSTGTVVWPSGGAVSTSRAKKVSH